MKVFVTGIAGGVGRRLARTLTTCGDEVTGPVRHQEQIEHLARQGTTSFRGDILAMPVETLAQAMHGCDAVVFTAGAGGKGGQTATTAIDGAGPGKVAKAAVLAGVQRFLLVSVFPEAWRERQTTDDFEHYIVEKKKAEANLARSSLDWVILRPSALTEDAGTGKVSLGPAEIHGNIARDDVAASIVELLHESAISRVVLEVTGGNTTITDAVSAIANKVPE